MEVMRLLVEVENANRGLNQNMDMPRALEASLRDQITFLKVRLEEMKDDSRYVGIVPLSYRSKSDIY